MTEKILPPLKAIRAYCVECSGTSKPEVANCPIIRCELFDYRFGKNPHRKKTVMSDSHKAKLRDGLLKYKAREAQN